MKTIISIIEISLFNLFPIPVAEPLVMFVKEIIPLIAAAITGVYIQVQIGFQKIQNMWVPNKQNFTAGLQ